MCLTAHLPAPAGPRRCRPPSHYKIYISICHISTLHPSRQALPIGPSPWGQQTPSLPTANTRLPALGRSGTQCEQVGPRGHRLKARAQLSDQTLEKKHTPFQPHTRGERLPWPPSGPDTPDSRGGKKKRRVTGPEGGLRTPWPPSLLLYCPVAHLARGVRARAPEPLGLRSTCHPHPPAPWFET